MEKTPFWAISPCQPLQDWEAVFYHTCNNSKERVPECRSVETHCKIAFRRSGEMRPDQIQSDTISKNSVAFVHRINVGAHVRFFAAFQFARRQSGNAAL